jgi:hypothetical protein
MQQVHPAPLQLTADELWAHNSLTAELERLRPAADGAPADSKQMMTVRGLSGAMRSLAEAEMREDNERYISARFGDANSFAIPMSVTVIRNKAIIPDFNSPNVILYRWPDAA